MGLMDLFKKKEDQNKEAYRDEVKKALSDGKLTADKMQRLEALKKELDVTAASQDYTMVRREQFQAAADAIKSTGKLTEKEEKELQRIQQFLGLKDQQIAQSKMELGRLRTLTEMRTGKFPVISAENVVLRGLRMGEGEVPHWAELAILLDAPDPGGTVGVGLKLVPKALYQAGSAAPYTLPMKGATPVAEGHLIMTSTRMIFKSNEGKSNNYVYDKPEEINLYKDGLRLRMGGGRAVMMKFRSVENADFIGILVSKGQNPELYSSQDGPSLDFS
jgi:hypothetical protein